MAKCRETAGFLFSHPCSESAGQQCSKCAKPVCAKHVRLWDQQPFCVGCHKDERRIAGQQQGDRDDPYYYSTFYYNDYDDYGQWDRFSRGDREAFDSDASDWSEDWGDDWEGDFDAS